MKRRKALQTLGLGLTAGLALPAWLSSCGPEDPGPEIEFDGTIAVIGAGASGLYVADILRAKGLKVVVYEASSRIGGRIRSLGQFEQNPLSETFPMEFGAERILGTDSLWAKMVGQLQLRTTAFSALTNERYLIEGVGKTRSEIDTDPDFIAAFNFLSELKNYSGSNVSVQQAIQNTGINSRVHAILNSWIGNKFGTSNDRLGITALAEGLNLKTVDAAESRLVANPMQNVLNARFSSVLPLINYSHAIKGIDYSGNRVKITGDRTVASSSESFTEEFDRVIVTVPVSILKEGDITFSPSLPSSKATSLSRMGMDPALRVILEFKQNFWGVDASFLYGASSVPEHFNVGIGETNPQLPRILSMTIMGQKAKDLADLGNGMIPAILDELDLYYDGKASLNVRTSIDEPSNILSLVQDWTASPYIRGGVAYVKPGGSNDDRVTLGEPVADKLFFAGEATDVNGQFGTISGALLSAERAAEEVIATIVS